MADQALELEPHRGLLGDVADELAWTFGSRRGWLGGLALNLAVAVPYVVSEHYDPRVHDRLRVAGIATGVAAWVLADPVNTDQLGSDERRTLASLERGDRVGRILCIKNLALALLLLPLAVAISVGTRLYVDHWRDIPHTVLLDGSVVFLWLGVGNLASVVLPYRQIALKARWRLRRSWPRWAVCLALPYVIFLVGVVGWLHWPVYEFCRHLVRHPHRRLLAWSFAYFCWGLVVWGAGLALAELYARVAPGRLRRDLERPW